LIGNDVVDLRDADARPDTLHRRFDARVFSPAERLALEQSGDSARHRWRLWSAKEASYKVARKLDASASFSPLRFEVELDREACGSVRYRGRCFAVRVLEREGGLHALARPEGAPDAELLHALLRLSHTRSGPVGSDELSRAVRRLAREHVAPRLGVAAADLEIRKQGRVPQLWLGGEPLPADLSLSHHGELVAFACALEPGVAASARRRGC
jgi:phosphopantetheinyl transferase (holo-ACP synthase)